MILMKFPWVLLSLFLPSLLHEKFQCTERLSPLNCEEWHGKSSAQFLPPSPLIPSLTSRDFLGVYIFLVIYTSPLPLFFLSCALHIRQRSKYQNIRGVIWVNLCIRVDRDWREILEPLFHSWFNHCWPFICKIVLQNYYISSLTQMTVDYATKWRWIQWNRVNEQFYNPPLSLY